MIICDMLQSRSASRTFRKDYIMIGVLRSLGAFITFIIALLVIAFGDLSPIEQGITIIATTIVILVIFTIKASWLMMPSH